MRPRTVQIILDIAHNVFYSGDLSVARPCSLSLNLDLYQNCVLTGDLKALLRALSFEIPLFPPLLWGKRLEYLHACSF